jgi:quercetin dioxygenase-like cupin family protein
MSMPFHHIADLTTVLGAIPPDTIISRTLHADEHLKAILFGFAAGQELSEHTAARPAILHILQGEADLTVGGETRQAGPHTWLFMQPHVPHSLVARTPLLMLLLLLEPHRTIPETRP